MAFSWKVVYGGQTPPPGGVVRPMERMSWGRTTGVGIQHVLAMFGATFVLPPIIGIPANTAVFFSGVGTILFLLIVRNRIPSYLGTSAAFIGPAFAIYAGGGGLPEVLFGILFAGLVFFVVGAIIQYFGAGVVAAVLPPALTGTVVMLIGLNLAGPVANDAYWQNDQWLGLLTMTATVLLLVFLRGFLQRVAILLAVFAGWVIAGIMDLLDIAPLTTEDGATRDRITWAAPTAEGGTLTLAEAPWIGLPEFTAPSVSLTAALLMLPVVIVLIAENAGHVKAVAEMTGDDLDADMGRAFMGDGAATAISGAFGGAGTTTYAENIGVMAATRVYSTAAYYIAAITAILFGLCPKFGVLVASIPGGVLAGVTIVLYGMIAVLGAKIWVTNRVDFGRAMNLVPAGIGVIIGAGNITLVVNEDLSLGGIALGSIAAIVSYHLFRWLGDDTTDAPQPGTAARGAAAPGDRIV